MKTRILLLLLGGISLFRPQPALGQAGPDYRLRWAVQPLIAIEEPPYAFADPITYKQARGKMLRHTLIPLGSGYLLMAVGGGLDYDFDNDNDLLAIPGSLLASYGSLVGPAMGNLHADDLGRGLGGIGARILGAMTIALGYSTMTGDIFTDVFYGEDSDNDGAKALIVVGAGIYLGSIVYNISTIRLSVDKYNERGTAGSAIRLAPSVDPRTSTPAVALRFDF